MRNILLTSIFLSLLCANIQAADMHDEIYQKVMNSLSEEGYINDLTSDERAYVSKALKNVIQEKLAETSINDLELSDGAQQQFLGGLIDAIKGVGKTIVGGIVKATSKVVSIGKSFVSKAAGFVKKYGPNLIRRGASLASNLLPLAAIIAPQLAIPAQVAAGLIAVVLPKLGKNPTPEQITEAAALEAQKLATP